MTARRASVLFVVSLCCMLCATAVVLMGCGGDSSDNSSDATPSTVTNTVVVTNTPAPAYANVAGNWNGPRNGIHFNLNLAQANDALTGNFSGANGEAGGVSGSVSGDHVVLTLAFTAGAAAGYFETWDGHVNAAVNDFTGTASPGNGGMASAFAMNK